jgi:hypothetical protein
VTPGRFDERDLPLADAMISLRLVHDEHAISELRAAAAATAAADAATATTAGAAAGQRHVAVAAIATAARITQVWRRAERTTIRRVLRRRASGDEESCDGKCNFHGDAPTTGAERTESSAECHLRQV